MSIPDPLLGCSVVLALAAPPSRAGAINAKVVNGSLVVTGPALNDDLTIDQLGLAPDQVRLDAGFQSTVNGVSTPVVISGFTKDLVLEMGADAENVFVKNLAVPRDVRADFGDGSNYLELNGVDVDRDFEYRGGSCDDDAVMQDSSVGGALRFSAGDRDNRLRLELVTLLGRCDARGGDQDDSFQWFDTGIAGRVDLRAGTSGLGALSINSCSLHDGLVAVFGDFGDSVSFQSPDIDGDVRLRLLTGLNEIDLDAMIVGGDLFIRAGDEHDEITFTNVAVNGTTTIQHGAGGDIVPP